MAQQYFFQQQVLLIQFFASVSEATDRNDKVKHVNSFVNTIVIVANLGIVEKTEN